MQIATASETRQNFAEVLGRVAYGKERITIERRGKPLAVLVPVEDLELLEGRTQAALHESEELLRSIADNIPGTVYQHIQHRDGRVSYSYISPGVTDMLGLDPDAITNQAATLTDNIHPDDRAERQRAIEESARTLAPYEAEYRHLTPSGETKWVRAIAQPRRQDNGDIIWDGLTLDVTEAKRAEEALAAANRELRESESKFQSLVSNIPSAIYRSVLDGEWRDEFMSDAVEEITGYPASDFIHNAVRSFMSIVHPDDREAHDRLAEKAIAEGKPFEHEYRIVHADGGIRWVHDSGRAVYGEDGEPSWFDGAISDITERKRTEEALRESEALMRQAAEMANLGHWVWDEIEDRCVYCSETLARMSGVTVEEYPAKYATMEALLEDVHPDDRARYARVISEAKKQARAYNIEFRDLAPSGEFRYLRERGEPILDKNGKLVRSVGTLQDVSDYKRTEEALRRSHDELELRVQERTRDIEEVNQTLKQEITERKRAKQALQASEARAKAAEQQLLDAIESISEGFVLFDSDERFVLCNQKYREFYPQIADMLVPGAKLEDLVRTALGRHAFQETSGTVEEWTRLRLEKYRTARGTHELHLQDGRWLLCSERKTQVGGIVGIRTDITERKRAEEALRESEARFRDFAEASADWFWEMDKDLRFTFMSENVERTLGAAASWYYGKTREDLLGKDYDREAWDRHLKTLRGHKAFRDFIYYHEGEEGRSAWLRASGVPIFAEDGSFLGYRGTGSNVTEQMEAERALRESEARFRAIIDNSPATISLKDLSGRYLLINRTYRDLVGLSSDEVQGLTPEDVLSEELAAAVTAHHKSVVESGETVVTEELMPLENGLHTFLAIKFPIRDDSGNLMGVGSIATDITDQKRAEETLRENAERLRQATQLAGLGHWVWDAIEDRCIYCSEELAKIHGTTPEEYMARASTLDGDLSMIHPEDRKRMKATFQSLKNGHGFETEYRVVTPDGRTRHVQEIARLVFDDSGAVVREYGTIQDISERRQAEKTIRTKEAWLSAILENAPIEIVFKDTDGKMFLANKKSLEWLGATLDQALGKRTSDFVPHDIAKIYEDADRQVLESGEPTQKEVTEHRGGRTYHYLSSKFPLKDETDAILGVCSITTDISHITEVQNQLRQAQKMEAVGQLTGGVAHDFNNLLAVVIGNVELLSDRIGKDDPQVQAVMRASTRGAELTQRLLAFSRQQPLHPRPVDLEVLVEGMTNLLSRTLGETIEIEVSSSPNLWAALADSGQVENALLNLALNARDAMPGGGTLTIETANAKLNRHDFAGREDARPGDYVVLAIRDTGHGIPPKVLEHVFEPFFTTKDVGEGTGLGLSMVYGFAQQSGGHITIDSAEGRGTIVKLYLPRATVAENAVSEETAASETVPRARGEAVLVIEDDPAVRELTVTVLESLGYHVMAARNEKAVSKILATNERIDLVLCDVVLPGGRSGPDFAAEAMSSRPDVKLLFMSGYASEELPPSLHDGVMLLNKPFRKAELAIKLREVLDGD